MPTIVSNLFDWRGNCRTGRLPIAASQTFKVGDWLSVNSSGQLQLAVASGTGTTTSGQAPAWSSGIANLIVGRASEDAQPSSNDPTILPTTKLYAEFQKAEPGTQFLMPIFHPTAASAYPNADILGTNYDLFNIEQSSTNWASLVQPGLNVWVANIDSNSAPCLQINDYLPDTYPLWPDIGQAAAPSTGTLSQYAYAWVEFLGGACYLTGARPITRSN